jgi:hypothetical protein
MEKSQASAPPKWFVVQAVVSLVCFIEALSCLSLVVVK